MSIRSKEKPRQTGFRGGLPWIVAGLFIGFLAGLVDELIYGVSMFRMIGGAVAGLPGEKGLMGHFSTTSS